MALVLLAMSALTACTPETGARSAGDEPATPLTSQVQLDTDAILAGMAHARARLGLQEDAAP